MQMAAKRLREELGLDVDDHDDVHSQIQEENKEVSGQVQFGVVWDPILTDKGELEN